jgi:hypothetical protein
MMRFASRRAARAGDQTRGPPPTSSKWTIAYPLMSSPRRAEANRCACRAAYPSRWLVQSVDRVRPREPPSTEGGLMLTILLIIVVLLLLFGGFGYSRRGRRL